MGSGVSHCTCLGRDAGSSNDLPSERPWYTFELSDEAKWLEQLRAHGFVVLRGLATAGEVDTAKDLVWAAINERYAQQQVDRSDPSTWDFPLMNQAGIVPWLAQSAGAWAVRGWPGVKKAFSRIWQTEELIVSMDSGLIWRPWWLRSEWRPLTEGLHLDQNPFSKLKLECVQGMVPLLPVTDASGGLQVVPGSHLDAAKEEFKRAHPHMRNSGDWCPCDDDALRQKAVLLHAEPGNLILWDSRTIHGGLVGKGMSDQDQLHSTELARISLTVSMTPRSWANKLVLDRRLEGFRKGQAFNHVPHEAGTSSGTVRAPVRRGFVPPSLTKAQQALL